MDSIMPTFNSLTATQEQLRAYVYAEAFENTYLKRLLQRLGRCTTCGGTFESKCHPK